VDKTDYLQDIRHDDIREDQVCHCDDAQDHESGENCMLHQAAQLWLSVVNLLMRCTGRTTALKGSYYPF
jgi:hypothetical protein